MMLAKKYNYPPATSSSSYQPPPPSSSPKPPSAGAVKGPIYFNAKNAPSSSTQSSPRFTPPTPNTASKPAPIPPRVTNTNTTSNNRAPGFSPNSSFGSSNSSIEQAPTWRSSPTKAAPPMDPPPSRGPPPRYPSPSKPTPPAEPPPNRGPPPRYPSPSKPPSDPPPNRGPPRFSPDSGAIPVSPREYIPIPLSAPPYQSPRALSPPPYQTQRALSPPPPYQTQRALSPPPSSRALSPNRISPAPPIDPPPNRDRPPPPRYPSPDKSRPPPPPPNQLRGRAETARPAPPTSYNAPSSNQRARAGTQPPPPPPKPQQVVARFLDQSAAESQQPRFRLDLQQAQQQQDSQGIVPRHKAETARAPARAASPEPSPLSSSAPASSSMPRGRAETARPAMQQSADASTFSQYATMPRKSLTKSPSANNPGNPTLRRGPILPAAALGKTNNTTMAGHDSITLPYHVIHTTHNTPMAAVDLGAKELVGAVEDKKGTLFKLSGTTWKEKYFVLRGNVLMYYNFMRDMEPRRQVPMTDVTLDRDTKMLALLKRPYAVHLIIRSTNKNMYLSGKTSDIMEDWITAFRGAGVVDKQILDKDSKAKETRQKEDQRNKERNQRKIENDYVEKQKKQVYRETLNATSKNLGDHEIALVHCQLKCISADARDFKGNQTYKIEVTFDQQTWTILRLPSKVLKLYSACYKVKEVRYVQPPKKSEAANAPEPEVVHNLQTFLDKLVTCRVQILGYPNSREAFLQFVAPINFGDIKPQGFVMPFKVPL